MSRRSIHIEGFDHGGQPIPAACRVGNIVMTGEFTGSTRPRVGCPMTWRHRLG
jgi:hypothetical protein